MQHRITCIYMYPSVSLNIIHHSASKHRNLGKANRANTTKGKEKRFSPSRKWSRHPYPGISSSGPTRTVAPRALAMAMLSKIRSIFPYSTATQIRTCMPAQKAMQSVSQYTLARKPGQAHLEVHRPLIQRAILYDKEKAREVVVGNEGTLPSGRDRGAGVRGYEGAIGGAGASTNAKRVGYCKLAQTTETRDGTGRTMRKKGKTIAVCSRCKSDQVTHPLSLLSQ